MLTTDTHAGKPDQDPRRPTSQVTPVPDSVWAVLKVPPGWMLWGAWTLATLLGGLIYLAILLLQTRFGQDAGAGLAATGPVGAFLTVGLAVVAQWGLLRRYLGNISPWRWLGGSLVGWGLLYLFAGGGWAMAYGGATADGADFSGLWVLIGLVSGSLLGLACGAGLGAVQAEVLKPYLSRPTWIWANTIAGGLIPLLAFLLWSLLGTGEGGVAAVLKGESLVRFEWIGLTLYDDSPWPLMVLATLLLIGGAGGLVFARHIRAPIGRGA